VDRCERGLAGAPGVPPASAPYCHNDRLPADSLGRHHRRPAVHPQRTDLIDAAVDTITACSTDQHDTHVAELAAVRSELMAAEQAIDDADPQCRLMPSVVREFRMALRGARVLTVIPLFSAPCHAVR
jgi:hypothetical protein